MRISTTTLVAAISTMLAGTALAQDGAPASAPDQPTAVMKAEDAAMTCESIGAEAAQLSEAMGGPPEGGWIRSMGGVARSGVAMLVPGAGLVMAGRDALTREDRERKAAEARSLAYRWYYLNGLSQGRDCQRATEAVTPTTAPAAAPAPAPAPAPVPNASTSG